MQLALFLNRVVVNSLCCQNLSHQKALHFDSHEHSFFQLFIFWQAKPADPWLLKKLPAGHYSLTHFIDLKLENIRSRVVTTGVHVVTFT